MSDPVPRVVLDYRDEPEGLMIEEANGSGAFSRVALRPRIKLAASSSGQRARELHHEVHRMCFIANSRKCEIVTEPVFNREGRKRIAEAQPAPEAPLAKYRDSYRYIPMGYTLKRTP